MVQEQGTSLENTAPFFLIKHKISHYEIWVSHTGFVDDYSLSVPTCVFSSWHFNGILIVL